MARGSLLEAEGLTKIYRRRAFVDRVSIHVGPGEVVGLLGRHGAGKTTTVRMLFGITQPSEGSIRFRGEIITTMPTYLRSRRGMGFLPQERSIFQRLTVEQNILAILETRSGAGEPQARAAQLLAEYGLTGAAKRRASMLSSGETRRLEICRAMVRNPAILILDEPFSGVDPIVVADLQGFIRRLRDRGVGILLTDHNVRDTLNVCDRAYIIHEGKIVKHGTPGQLEGPSAA